MSRSAAFLVAILAGLPAHSRAADWTPVRVAAQASLAIDTASVRRTKAETRFTYLIDYAVPQGDASTNVYYRSLVVSAAVRCAARTMALRSAEAYSMPGGKGVLLGTSTPAGKEAGFMAIEGSSSDEELARFVCKSRGPR